MKSPSLPFGRLQSIFLALFVFLSSYASAQDIASRWSDSVYASLTPRERIAQLIVARLSTYDGKSKTSKSYFDRVLKLVKDHNIGGVCVFQGSPEYQANQFSQLKAAAKTPLLFSIDAEWGVGMRLIDSVLPLPKQMMLGAMRDSSIVYTYGKVVAEQCKRLGIHMNYAPVVDVNNNPNNPVINDRSFGEDKEKVAQWGIQYAKGMQDHGILACAKHFPGHGDVTVDSHHDLPIIEKNRSQLDSLELYPFRKLAEAGVGSMMIAHLNIPAIDARKNRPTSLSKNNIEGILRNEIGYQGLTITDGLEMKGVKNFFHEGEAAVESLIAGNDLLCLPDSIPMILDKIEKAIRKKRLSWNDIEFHCKRVLRAKYQYVLSNNGPVETRNLTNDLNEPVTRLRQQVAEQAITLLQKTDDRFFPMTATANTKPVYIAFGTSVKNTLADSLTRFLGARCLFIDPAKLTNDSVTSVVAELKTTGCPVIIGIHGLSRNAAANYGITDAMVTLVNNITQSNPSIILQFGNAYAAKNWCNAGNLVVCYEDDAVVQTTAFDMLVGRLPYRGTLPVTVCSSFRFGHGWQTTSHRFPSAGSNMLIRPSATSAVIDSIVIDAIKKKAMPGGVLVAVKDGKLLYQQAYGTYTNETQATNTSIASVYDLASLTKILATTLAVMKLWEEGTIDLDKTLSAYLPETIRTNKANIRLKQLLIHEGGMVPYIPFYKELLNGSNRLQPVYVRTKQEPGYDVAIADGLFMKNELCDQFYQKVLASPLNNPVKYVYSDNDFIFLGKVVEVVSGQRLHDYVQGHFYKPMNLHSMGFLPLQRLAPTRIVPSIREDVFRGQEIRGYVHDPGANFMNGVSGHAGLFGSATDIACLLQMLLNGGEWQGKRYLRQETIQTFTSYQSNQSRRGFGFDKPEKDNAVRKEPYPSVFCSPNTFGHTGFTGTCAWADPDAGLAFVFLSNRTYPTENDLFKNLNVRGKLMDAVYRLTR
ncbi:MAG: glycoside hydrolase family 3 N-terminal domain-containing protein [Ferruginibacter sp.]